MDGKYHRMDGNAIRRPRETGSISGAMEDHDSQPYQRRRHLMVMTMMMMMMMTKCGLEEDKDVVPIHSE